MLRNNPDYRRLKVGGLGATGSASYWLGKEHLLVVVNSAYVEKYQRFAYADIQAVLVRKTRVHYVWGFGFAALAIGCLLGILETMRGQDGASLADGNRAWLGVLSVVAVIAIGLTSANGFFGASCVCHLRTALQSFPLPQVRRWKKAQQLLAELTPLILMAQGNG